MLLVVDDERIINMLLECVVGMLSINCDVIAINMIVLSKRDDDVGVAMIRRWVGTCVVTLVVGSLEAGVDTS